jgi:hypothetical protein
MPYSDPAEKAEFDKRKRAVPKAARQAMVAEKLSRARKGCSPRRLRTLDDVLEMLEQARAVAEEPALVEADPAGYVRAVALLAGQAIAAVRQGELNELKAMVEELERRLGA